MVLLSIDTILPQGGSLVPRVEAPPVRTVLFEFYDPFHYPYSLQQEIDIWNARAQKSFNEFRVVSYGEGNGIFVHVWEQGGGGSGQIWYYAPIRIRVTGTSLGEINIDTVKTTGHRAYIPHNLMGGTPAAVTGGYANLNWYVEHVNQTRASQLGLTNFYDGWAAELRGTIVMDVVGAQKVLGISEASPGAILTWFVSSQNAVEDQWVTWLDVEGNTRNDIYSMYGSPMLPAGSYSNRKTADLSMTTGPGSNEVTLQINAFYWGIESLMARWFKETFMPRYEYYYTDIKLNMLIGSQTSDAQLDMVNEYGLYMWTKFPTAFQPSAWAFESIYGNYFPSERVGSKYHHAPDYDKYYFYDFFADPNGVIDNGNGVRKKYYNIAPGHTGYNTYSQYDYTPSSFNLASGEILRLNYTTNRNVWVLDQTMTGLYNRTGVLEIGRFEPYLTDIPSGQASIDVVRKIVTITGPFDMEGWSQRTLPGEWIRLSDRYRPTGVLPWGSPYIEFNVIPSTGVRGDANGDGRVDILDQIIVGVNLGDSVGSPGFEPMADVWKDGIIDNLDLISVGANIPKT